MKTLAITLVCVASWMAGRAQSVADTLTTLNGKVATVENRAYSDLVVSRSDKEGGQFYLSDSDNKVNIQLRSDPSGGNIDIYSRSGGKTVYIGTEKDKTGSVQVGLSTSELWSLVLGVDPASGGHLRVYDSTGVKLASELNEYGLFILDGDGSKQLASFTKTADGKSVQVIVNGKQVHDYAEVFDIAVCIGLKPGSIVSASSDGKGIQLPGRSYDPSVVGVLSGAGAFKPGMQIGSREDGSSTLPVAVSGQVYVRVDTEAGPIKVGDLLVSSSSPGIGMRGADASRLTGTVVGKALQPYSGPGESLIRMLVMTR